MTESKAIPQRSQIAESDKWAIADIYATDAAWFADLEQMKTATTELASFAGKISQDGNALLTYLTKLEQLHVLGDSLGNYCSRKSDEDTRDATYQAMQGQFMSSYVAFSAATSFETRRFSLFPMKIWIGFTPKRRA